jgi:ribosomal protein S18 acetylase RimI-like enzyme
MPVALRVDRCVSLQLNDDLQRRGVGRTALLLAEMDVDEGDEAIATPATATDPLAFPRPLFFLSRLLQPSVRTGLDAALNAASSSSPPTTILVGAATVDSFGDLVPPKQLDPGRDGAVGWAPRHGGDRNHYAYLSNVAVAPFVRRRGVARRLVRAAERLAAGFEDLDLGEGEQGDDGDATDSAAPDWSCGAAALHCSPENEAALRLYGSMGYRRVALEPAWAPYLNGRGAGGRCYLMVRRLGRRKDEAGER